MLAQIVDKKMTMNKTPKLMKIDIEDLKENENNIYPENDILELAENIQEYGLLKPLEVYEDFDGTYTLIGGHRRLKALQYLNEEEKLQDLEISCLVYATPEKNSATEKLQLIISNAQRILNEEDKLTITKELLSILNEDPSLKAPGLATVSWIASFLGCSARTAQKYKNLVENPNEENKKKEEFDEVKEKYRELGEKLEYALSNSLGCNVKVKSTPTSINLKVVDKNDTKHTNDMLLALYEYIEKNIINN